MGSTATHRTLLVKSGDRHWWCEPAAHPVVPADPSEPALPPPSHRLLLGDRCGYFDVDDVYIGVVVLAELGHEDVPERTPLQGAFDDDVLASLQAHLADVVDDFGGFGVDQGREFPGGYRVRIGERRRQQIRLVTVRDGAAQEFVLDDVRVQISGAGIDQVTFPQRRRLTGPRWARGNYGGAAPVAVGLGEVEVPLDDLMQGPVPPAIIRVQVEGAPAAVRVQRPPVLTQVHQLSRNNVAQWFSGHAHSRAAARCACRAVRVLSNNTSHSSSLSRPRRYARRTSSQLPLA